jgi:hypothetical protein
MVRIDDSMYIDVLNLYVEIFFECNQNLICLKTPELRMLHEFFVNNCSKFRSKIHQNGENMATIIINYAVVMENNKVTICYQYRRKRSLSDIPTRNYDSSIH